jgi:hypothetical protein
LSHLPVADSRDHLHYDRIWQLAIGAGGFGCHDGKGWTPANKHVPTKQQRMAIFSLNKDRPKISETAFITPNATVIGQVRLGDDVSVWPGAVIRGYKDPITIKDGSNVQDGAVIHVAGPPDVDRQKRHRGPRSRTARVHDR